jgi:hypothetical protein
MRPIRHATILFVAFFLLLIGLVIPLLMTIQVMEPNLFLAFASYALSALGLLLGTIGIAMNMPRRRE